MRQRQIKAEKERRKQTLKLCSKSSEKEQEWEKNHLIEKRRFARISKDIAEVQELLDSPPRIVIPERKFGVHKTRDKLRHWMARQDKTRQNKSAQDKTNQRARQNKTR